MRAIPILILLQACASTTRVPTPRPGVVASDEYELSAVLFPGGAPPRSMDVIETLVTPVSVRGWTRDTLLLADGRAISLDGAGDLRRHSILLAEATREGVEVRDATLIGLIRIWHWCGNDPIARHVARVDLADLLRFHAEDVEDDRVITPAGFSPSWGWDRSDFHAFREWQVARAPRVSRSRALFVVRKDLDVLVVFADGRYLRAQGLMDSKTHAKVSDGQLPKELLRYLNYLVFEEGQACSGRPPFRIEGELADFVFDVLRRR